MQTYYRTIDKAINEFEILYCHDVIDVIIKDNAYIIIEHLSKHSYLRYIEQEDIYCSPHCTIWINLIIDKVVSTTIEVGIHRVGIVCLLENNEYEMDEMSLPDGCNRRGELNNQFDKFNFILKKYYG